MLQTLLGSRSIVSSIDAVWARVREEAEVIELEPELAAFIYSSVLHHECLEDAIVHRIAERLHHSELSSNPESLSGCAA